MSRLRDAEYTVGIIGHGNYGRFFAARLVESGQCDVYAYDQDEAVQNDILNTSGAIPSARDDVLQCDYVVAAIHAEHWEILLQNMQGKLKDDIVIIGPFSMQEWPEKIAKQYLQQGQYFPSHAMFGPTSYARNRNSCAGFQMMVGEGVLPPPLQLLVDLGVEALVMTPGEHDKISAYSLGLHQMVGNVLGRMAASDPSLAELINPETEGLPSDLMPLAHVCDSVKRNSISILENLCLYNQFADNIFTQFITALKTIQQEFLSHAEVEEEDATDIGVELLTYLGLGLFSLGCEDQLIETKNYQYLKQFIQNIKARESLPKPNTLLTNTFNELINTAQQMQASFKDKSKLNIWSNSPPTDSPGQDLNSSEAATHTSL